MSLLFTARGVTLEAAATTARRTVRASYFRTTLWHAYAHFFCALAAGGVELRHAYGVSRLGKPAADVCESCLRGPCHTQLQSAVMDGGGATSRCLGTPGPLVAVAGLFSSAIRDSRRSRSLSGMLECYLDSRFHPTRRACAVGVVFHAR